MNIFPPCGLGVKFLGFLQNWYRFISQLILLCSFLKVFLTKFLISVHQNASICPKLKKNSLKYVMSLRYAKISLRAFPNQTSQNTIASISSSIFSLASSPLLLLILFSPKPSNACKCPNEINGLSSFLTHHDHSGVDIVDQLLPSYKSLCPECRWQGTSLPNHIFSIYLSSFSWQNSNSFSHHLNAVMFQGSYFRSQQFLF